MKKIKHIVITNQPEFSWSEILINILKHPMSLKIIGPDTALFSWQIARKLKWWREADRITVKLMKIDPHLLLSYTASHHVYQVHQRKNTIWSTHG